MAKPPSQAACKRRWTPPSPTGQKEDRGVQAQLRRRIARDAVRTDEVPRLPRAAECRRKAGNARDAGDGTNSISRLLQSRPQTGRAAVKSDVAAQKHARGFPLRMCAQGFENGLRQITILPRTRAKGGERL